MAAPARAAHGPTIPKNLGTGGEVLIGTKKVKLLPTNVLGQGGEAVVYRVTLDDGKTYALKVFKGPQHPDYGGDKTVQHAVTARILDHQTKLAEFPKGMPSNVIAPLELAKTADGSLIVGYTMSLIPDSEVIHRYVERDFHETLDLNAVMVRLENLRETVAKIHTAGAVIGDFNDLNVLVTDSDNAVYVIDADSMQYGRHFYKLFTDRFVDPLLCEVQPDPGDPLKSRLMLVKPHSEVSDWYAYNIMVLQSLLRVGPYSGVYKPPVGAPRVSIIERPVKGVSIFDPHVIYPKVGVPINRLPDDLLHYFEGVFQKHRRDVIAPTMIQNLRWTTCSSCGVKHARALCPVCAHQAPAAVKETVVKRGKVTATTHFRTTGTIVFATMQGSDLAYLYVEDGSLRREGGRRVVSMPRLDPKIRYRINGDRTLLGRGSMLVVQDPAHPQPERFKLDCFGNLPVFDANKKHFYRLENGVLLRSGPIQGSSEIVGTVLEGQTLFWAGAEVGYGFYRVGEGGTVGFLFDAERPRSLNDGIETPSIRGQLIDATCSFGGYVWVFTTTSFNGKETNRCVVYDRSGALKGLHEVDRGDPSWLGSIRGKCAFGRNLFVSTDDGIRMIGVENGSIREVNEYPDTQPFVDSASHLLPGKTGIHVVGRKEILLLQIEN